MTQEDRAETLLIHLRAAVARAQEAADALEETRGFYEVARARQDLSQALIDAWSVAKAENEMSLNSLLNAAQMYLKAVGDWKGA